MRPMNEYNFKRSILAYGAESKGVFSLTNGRDLFISRDFGDLDDYANFSRYEKDIRKRLKVYGLNPELTACDMHPGYNSTALAEENAFGGDHIIKIQHHHAHIASCMLENNLKGKVLGIAFDGTGYGADGSVWGGEFLIATFKDFKRGAHLEYIPMPGGDKAVTEPWRMAAAYLRRAFGDGFIELDIPLAKRIKRKEWELLKNMVDKGINSPLTSSMGRFFDAIASMVLCILKVGFEAEAAIKLQQYAEMAESEDGEYRFNLSKKESLIVETDKIVKEVVKDVKKGVEKAVVAAKFHNTVAGIMREVSLRLRKSTGVKKVVLSGGVFQNKFLLKKSVASLEDCGFDVYTHKVFSTTDAGISAGQAMIAEARE